MNARIVKSLVLIIGGPTALLLIGVAIYLLSDYIAYQKAEITTALLRVLEPSREIPGCCL